MPENSNNFAGAGPLPAGLSGGDVNLSQSSINMLANSMSTSFSGVLRSFLPMIASAVSNALSYSVGINQYTQQQFMAPMMGNSSFSAYQANRAYSMGLINKNAYIQNYAEALGFKGLPTQMSNYLSQMPGGMDRVNSGLERAWAITQRETGLNPLLAMQQDRKQQVENTYNAAADDFIAKANKLKILDGSGKFKNVKQISEAISRYGNVTDPENENERWKALSDDQKKQVREMFDRASELAGIRDDAVDENGVSYVDTEIENRRMDANRDVRLAHKRELEILKQRRKREGAVTADMSPEEQQRAKEAGEELDRRIAAKEAQIDIDNMGGIDQLKENARSFMSTSREAKMFKLATVADMAVSNGMAFDLQAGYDAVAAGKMTMAELNAKQSAQQFVLKAGGEDNARMIAAEFSRVLADSENFAPGGIVAKTIEAGMKNLDENATDEQVQGKMAHIMGLLGSTDNDEQIRGMQEFMALSSAAGTAGDMTGMAGVVEMYGKATALAGGDQKAAQDMVAMAMTMNGQSDITKLTQKDLDESNRLVSLGAMIGPDALAKTFDQVTSSLEGLGIATRDVTGKQTRLAGVLSKASVELQAGLIKNGGMSKQDAAIVADEAMQDLVGSRSGESMAALLELGSAAGLDDKKLGELSEQLAGKTTEDQLAWLRENGYSNIADRWDNATDEERRRYAARGVQFETEEARRLHMQAANRELFTDTPLDQSAALQLEGKEFNEETFNQEWFKKSWSQRGFDIDKLDSYDEQTQDMIRRSSGLDKEGLGRFFQRSVGHFAGGGNGAISETDSGEATVDKMVKAYDGMATPVEVPDDTKDGTAERAGEVDSTKGLGKARQQNIEEVDAAITDFKESIKNAEGFFDKVSDVGDKVVDKLGGAAVEAAKALQGLVDVLKGMNVVQ
jgi:hypothetical protein